MGDLKHDLLFFLREINISYNEINIKEEISMKKKRGTFGLFVDFILTILTGGLWLIWILIRYLRNS